MLILFWAEKCKWRVPEKKIAIEKYGETSKLQKISASLRPAFSLVFWAKFVSLLNFNEKNYRMRIAFEQRQW